MQCTHNLLVLVSNVSKALTVAGLDSPGALSEEEEEYDALFDPMESAGPVVEIGNKLWFGFPHHRDVDLRVVMINC